MQFATSGAASDLDRAAEYALARQEGLLLEAGEANGPPALRLGCPPHELPARFAQKPLLALRLFRLSATLGLSAEPDTLAAALAAAPGLAALDGAAVRNELNNALTGCAPSALAPLLASGGLAPFGIPGPAGPEGLAPLNALPADLLCRWWGFLRLAGAPLKNAAKHLAFGRSFLADAARLDALFRAGPPQDRLALKRQLAQGVPMDYAELAAAFAVLEAGFAPAAGLYAGLLESGEPFRAGQLAITEAGLLAEGVRPKRLHETHRRLLDAVVEQPSLNSYPVLAGLARQMQRYL